MKMGQGFEIKEVKDPKLLETIAEGKKVAYSDLNDNSVELSLGIARDFILSGDSQAKANVSNAELANFIMLAKAMKLNPFLREVYLVKFKGDVQYITSKDVYLKRASRMPTYQGFKAGVVTINKDGAMSMREGTIVMDNERLIGGWCEILDEKRSFGTHTVSLREYDKGYSTWKSLKATMIRKVALAQAHKEAYPNELGQLYLAEEMQDRETISEASYEVLANKDDDKSESEIEGFKNAKSVEKPAKAAPKKQEIKEFFLDLDEDKQRKMLGMQNDTKRNFNKVLDAIVLNSEHKKRELTLGEMKEIVAEIRTKKGKDDNKKSSLALE